VPKRSWATLDLYAQAGMPNKRLVPLAWIGCFSRGVPTLICPLPTMTIMPAFLLASPPSHLPLWLATLVPVALFFAWSPGKRSVKIEYNQAMSVHRHPVMRGKMCCVIIMLIGALLEKCRRGVPDESSAIVLACPAWFSNFAGRT